MRRRPPLWSVIALLSLSGCKPAYAISSFVEAPADASCKTLGTALRESGWGRHEYLTLDETWILHAEPRRHDPARTRYWGQDRPSAWALSLRCVEYLEPSEHPIPVRNCPSDGRVLGIVNPADIRAIYPELAPGTRCWMTLSYKGVNGRWGHTYTSSEVRPSARPLLLSAPRAEVSP